MKPRGMELSCGAPSGLVAMCLPGVNSHSRRSLLVMVGNGRGGEGGRGGERGAIV